MYSAATQPPPLAASADGPIASDGLGFGIALRSKFQLSDGYTSLNHGSYGAVPRPVQQRQSEFMQEQESRPDLWFRETYFNYIDVSRNEISKLINASIDDVVLIENASSAVNSLLRSLIWKKGDKIVRFNNAYGMVIETIAWLKVTYGVEEVIVDLAYPLTDNNSIIEPFRNKIKDIADGSLRVAIFSHVVSVPTVVEPVVELTEVCRSIFSDCLVLIDGAHSLGTVHLDVREIGCDFYLGNCHKWMFTPKGSAFLYVNKAVQTESFPQPSVISGTGRHDFVGRYAYTGTRDYTPMASIPAGISFYRDYLGGFEVINGYCHGLLTRVTSFLVQKWDSFALVDPRLCSTMVNIALPIASQDMADYISKRIFKDHNLFYVTLSIDRGIVTCPPSVFEKIGWALPEDQTVLYYTRLSFQVYNSFHEFEKFADLFMEYRLAYINSHAI